VNISTNYEPGNELFPIREKKALNAIASGEIFQPTLVHGKK
jgi:hypothetical protein